MKKKMQAEAGTGQPRGTVLTHLRRNWQFLAMMIIPTVFFIIFCYFPMFGITMAFQNYKVGTPFLSGDVEWVGLQWFKQLVNSHMFPRLLRNTLLLNIEELIVAFPLSVIFALLLDRTRYGRHLCAVGASEKVARYAAIRTGRIRFFSYLAVGAAAGLSALLLGARLSSISSTNAGLAYELDAIAAVIIGGTAMSGGRGSLCGTLAGVAILGIVSNVLDMWGVSVNLQGTVKGLVIIAAVLIQRKEAAA